MKTIKPQAIGVLCRPFENGRDYYLCVTSFLFFSLDSSSTVFSEMELWKLLPKELGNNAVLDIGMPKLKGELLLSASAYPPSKKPEIACLVRACLGSIDKTLRVVGHRFWKPDDTPSNPPPPFTEMPITYENAFGGPGYPQNPLGKGFAPTKINGAEAVLLPNIEDPKQLIRSRRDKPMPAGFGPYDLTWKQRFSKAGTYDKTWLKTRFPGFAKDMDWTMFNAAPDDQHISGYFRGDERFRLENMHPERHVIEGQLPGFSIRAFVTLSTPEGEQFHEISTRLDTVWMFPHAERGVLVFRGITKIKEDDASDVLHLVLAAERIGESKPVGYYQNILQQRLDKVKGPLLALRDRDLLPNEIAVKSLGEIPPDSEMGPIGGEDLLRKNLTRRSELQRQKMEQQFRELGFDPALLPSVPTPPIELDPNLANLPELVEQMKSFAEEQNRLAQTKKDEMERKIGALCAEHGLNPEKFKPKPPESPPRFSAEGELAKLNTLVEQARAGSLKMPQIEAALASPELRSKLSKAEAQFKETYRSSAHHFPQPVPVTEEFARQLRKRVEESAERNFAGQDLTGADLSNLNLTGADFHGALLEDVNLSNSDLTGVDFSNAVLVRANLSAAKLNRANLSGANLGGARLAGASLEEANLGRAILIKADLSNASFMKSNLEKAQLSEAIFHQTDFTGSHAPELMLLKSSLVGAKFASANLSKSNFIEAQLGGVDFTGADLSSSVFVACSADEAIFRGIKASNIRLVNDCSFQRTDFTEAVLDGANLRGTRFLRSKFDRAQLGGSDLSTCNLTDTSFYRAAAKGTQWNKAVLVNASLVSANLMNASFQKADISNADLTGSNLFRADFSAIRGRARSLKDALTSEVRLVQREEQ